MRVSSDCLWKDSLPEQLEHGRGPLPIADVAFWLWGDRGCLRATFFRSPLRFGPVTSGEEWTHAEAAASAVVGAIVDQAAHFEESHQAGKSWRL